MTCFLIPSDTLHCGRGRCREYAPPQVRPQLDKEDLLSSQTLYAVCARQLALVLTSYDMNNSGVVWLQSVGVCVEARSADDRLTPVDAEITVPGGIPRSLDLLVL